MLWHVEHSKSREKTWLCLVYSQDFSCVLLRHSLIYYIDMSVLPKNRRPVFSIWNYIRDSHSFVFPLFFFYFWNTHIYVIKRKFIQWFEHIYRVYLLVEKNFTCLLHSLVKYFFHSKINLICSRHHVISFI